MLKIKDNGELDAMQNDKSMYEYISMIVRINQLQVMSNT
jgi:hypothetical protein